MLLLEQFEHLTLHPKNTAKLKELVLQLAVQGKLTENWRKQNPAVEPASELLKRIEAEKAQLVKEKKIKKGKLIEPVSEDHAPYTLPEGWVWCLMESIVEIKSSNIKSLVQGSVNDIPYVKVGDMNSAGNETEIINSTEYFKVPNEFIDTCIPTRSIIFPKRGGAIATNKRRKILSRPILIDSNMMAFSVPESLDYDYVFRWFETIDLGKLGNNGVIPQINNQDIYPLHIPIPPLAEQGAIVARVEELMHKIEELEQQTEWRLEQKKNLGAAALQKLIAAADEDLPQHWHFLQQHFQTIFDEPANLKKLRETILQLAVQGKLTTTWRKQNPAVEPAAQLLKRIQRQKAKLVQEKKIKKEKPLEPVSEDEVPYELPEGWVWCRLENLTDISSGVTKGKVYKGEVVDTPYLRVANVQRGYLDLTVIKNIIVSREDFDKNQLEPLDLLMIEGGDPDKLGRCAIWQNEIEDCIYQNHVFRVRPLLKSEIDEYFLMLFINSPFSRAYYESCAKRTTNLASINKTQMRGTPIALPPLAEQEAIFAKVDQLMQLCDELEQQLQQSKQEAEALMQAVVQEALQVQEEVV